MVLPEPGHKEGPTLAEHLHKGVCTFIPTGALRSRIQLGWPCTSAMSPVTTLSHPISSRSLDRPTSIGALERLDDRKKMVRRRRLLSVPVFVPILGVHIVIWSDSG